jgi:hypothetical protein
LVVPIDKKVEALRMACGLTLLDDQVAVAAWEALPDGPDADEQLEALAFSEVPLHRVDHDFDALARQIIDSDVVYFV